MKTILKTTTLVVITILSLSSQSLQNQLLAQSANGGYEVRISESNQPLRRVLKMLKYITLQILVR